MDYAKAIEPVTVFKTRSAALIRQAKRSGQPVIITQNGKPTAVLQDVESFQRQREALLLLKYLARVDAELRQGKGVSHAKALAHFDRTLAGLKRGKSLQAVAISATPLIRRRTLWVFGQAGSDFPAASLRR